MTGQMEGQGHITGHMTGQTAGQGRMTDKEPISTKMALYILRNSFKHVILSKGHIFSELYSEIEHCWQTFECDPLFLKHCYIMNPCNFSFVVVVVVTGLRY